MGVSLLALVLALTALPAREGVADEGAGVRFSWAFLYRGDDGITRPIDYAESPVRLRSGDRIRIYLKPLNACYTYLYLYDSQRQLFLFFPRDFAFWDTRYRIGELYSLPEGQSWFYLDENSGVEVFYLIVSDRRLPALETSTARYLGQKARHGGDRSLTRKYEVLDEIRTILKASSHLAGPAERPVAVAGEFRGVGEESEVPGVTVEAGKIYVRTIRLEH